VSVKLSGGSKKARIPELRIRLYFLKGEKMTTNISPSRTYMVAVYDPLFPEDFHFERVVLPEETQNTIKNAKFYYILSHLDAATTIRILLCVSIEEYLQGAREEESQEKLVEVAAGFDFVRGDVKTDIEKTLKMLYEWNFKQKEPSITYLGALTSLFKRVAIIDDFECKFSELQNKAIALLQIE